ncbi:MAG TPA: hypothetical protein PKA64_22170, partial [Myxococcota bacterium]|nr:hypothetical protein [Myxococcota bacterium]
YASASRQADLALDACVEGANGWLCAAQAEAPASRSRALASGGHATWAVAGALIATSVVTLALDSTTTGASFAPFPLPGGGGLLLHVPL